MATSILLCAFAFLLIAGSCWAESMRGVGAATCKYKVTIQTSCLPGSGTSNHVFIKVTDKSGNSVQKPLPNTMGFDDCGQNVFTIAGKCLTDVCEVKLFTVGPDDWTVDAVDVSIMKGRDTIENQYFDFGGITISPNEWEALNKCNSTSRGKGVGAASCMYKVTIQTSCLPGSGTSNHVFIKVTDKSGNSLQKPIPNTMGFDDCEQNVFTIAGKCLSEVCEVKLFTVGPDDWTVDTVDVSIMKGRDTIENQNFDFGGVTISPNEWEAKNKCNSTSRGKEIRPCSQVSVSVN